MDEETGASGEGSVGMRGTREGGAAATAHQHRLPHFRRGLPVSAVEAFRGPLFHARLQAHCVVTPRLKRRNAPPVSHSCFLRLP